MFFDDVKDRIVFRALIRNGTDFSHPVVIPNLCACPVAFDGRAGCGNGSPGFTGNDDCPDTGLCKVDVVFCGNLSHVDGIRWRATHNGHGIADNRFNPGEGAHPTAWHTECTDALACIETRPESEEGAERECKEDSILGGYTTTLKDGCPAFNHPVPRCRSVQPADCLPTGSTRLRDACVRGHRVG